MYNVQCTEPWHFWPTCCPRSRRCPRPGEVLPCLAGPGHPLLGLPASAGLWRTVGWSLILAVQPHLGVLVFSVVLRSIRGCSRAAVNLLFRFCLESPWSSASDRRRLPTETLSTWCWALLLVTPAVWLLFKLDQKTLVGREAHRPQWWILCLLFIVVVEDGPVAGVTPRGDGSVVRLVLVQTDRDEWHDGFTPDQLTLRTNCLYYID